MTKTGTVSLDLESKEFKAILQRSKEYKDGFRIVYFPIRFKETFSNLPQVLLSVAGFSGGGDSFRYKLRPVRTSEAGFEIKLIVTGADWIRWIDVAWLATDA